MQETDDGLRGGIRAGSNKLTAGLMLSLNNSNMYFRASFCRAVDLSFCSLDSLSPYNKPVPYPV